MVRRTAGCLTEFELFQAYRGELPAERLADALCHILDCPLCHEQWRRCGVEEQLASGIRSALAGDAAGADATPGVAEMLDLPEQLSIPGFRLRGDFVEGGQSRVYRAIHEASQEEVAIKVFHNSPLNEGGRIRFTRELQSLARLRHPNVIPIRSAGEIVGHAYYVMPWIEGGTLDEYLSSQRLTTREKVEMMAKICSALDHAHKRGVMHLDLKPYNVRVDSSGEPLVMDFGLARLITDEPKESDSLGLGVAGTPMYMAPEQVKDRENVDVRADVYTLGLLLYEMLAGCRARDAYANAEGGSRRIELATQTPRPIRQVAPHVRGELAAIVSKATAAWPADRYGTVEAMLDDLRRYLSNQPVEAMGTSLWYRLRKLGLKHLTIILCVTSVVLILGVSLLIRRETQRYAAEAYSKQEQYTQDRFEATERLFYRRVAREYEQLSTLFEDAGDHERAEEMAETAADARKRAAPPEELDRAARGNGAAPAAP